MEEEEEEEVLGEKRKRKRKRWRKGMEGFGRSEEGDGRKNLSLRDYLSRE